MASLTYVCSIPAKHQNDGGNLALYHIKNKPIVKWKKSS